MRITAVTNQKGGVGKTSTAHALGTGLTQQGYNVLLVDLDQQGSLSYLMRADTTGVTAYDVMKGDAAARDAIQHTVQGDIMASSPLFAGADMQFTRTGKEQILKEKIRTIHTSYDYIIIDTPPTMGILTINALAAAYDVVIPLGADILSIQGLAQLYETIGEVKRYCNSNLTIAGLLITRWAGRSVLSKDLMDVIKKQAAADNIPVYAAAIREAIAVKEAQVQQESIFTSGTKSNVAQDYANFIQEYKQRS